MRQLKFTYLAVIGSIAAILVAQPAISKDRKTIKDYFLELPSTYIRINPGGSQISRPDRSDILKRGGTIVDLNNGYLRTVSDSCFHELAMFNRAGASPLIAVNTVCTMGGSLAIVDPDRQWKNVTTQVFPMQTLKTSKELGGELAVNIKLPRQGRIITIGDDDKQVRWNIDFKNGKFQIVGNN